LVHVDLERAGEALVNRRFAYVALSRSRYDAHVYTNDKAGLTEALGREHAHRSAIEHAIDLQPAAPTMTMSSSQTRTRAHRLGR
jgi:ATP-dependent exoDNAse (exonuclease V) alpha subunit